MPMPMWMMKGKMDKMDKMDKNEAMHGGKKEDKMGMMKNAISRKLAKRGSKSKY